MCPANVYRLNLHGSEPKGKNVESASKKARGAASISKLWNFGRGGVAHGDSEAEMPLA